MSKGSCKICCFCGLSREDELEFGKIYKHDEIVTHYYCLLLSSNMEQRGNDDQGILGFLAADIRKEIRRGKKLVCSYCKKNGATLGCCNVRCKKIFHYPCGRRAGTLNQFFGEFRSYCLNHRPKQKIEAQVLEELAKTTEVVCYICYDRVDPYDTIDTLWAPCCKKNAWFHRNCVQQLAMSAGYFFKCPLCNDKKVFQKAMLEFGIFIPSQDASWELVPNAFQELLYRHDQCDAPICLCPKGRKYTSFNNAKWELVLCRTCGSQGIHMACGQLKWANPVWDCKECISILGKSKEAAGSSTTRDMLQNMSDSEDSDSDISVGKDSPVPVSSTLPLTSTPEVSTIRQRPGPRSFKLRQQFKISRTMQGEQETNETVNTVSSSTSINQHSLQSISSTGKNTVNIDTALHDCKDFSKLQHNKLGNSIITLDSDDEDVVEVSNCSPLNDVFIIESKSRNKMANLNQSSILYNSNLSRIEELSYKSNFAKSDTNNFLKSDLNTIDTDNLKKSSTQSKTKFGVSDDAMQSNHEACTDFFSHIKITNIVSLAPEEFESGSSVDQEWNNFKYLELQSSNGLIKDESMFPISSSENNTLVPDSKRKLDKTATSRNSCINECKKMRKDDSTLRKTSQSSYTSLDGCTSIMLNNSNSQISNNNNSVNMIDLQNKSLCVKIEQIVDKNTLHTSMEKENASNNLLNNKTDTFAILTNNEKDSTCTHVVNGTNVTLEDIKVNNNIRNCHGNAGSRPATESRSRCLTINTRSSYAEEGSVKATNSESKESQISEPWQSCNNVEMAIPKRRTSSNSSRNYWKKGRRNSRCSCSRLIPEYIRLRDLKFHVDNTNNLQMVLYDKFSININMECATIKNTLDTSEKKVVQQNVCKTQNEACLNLRSENILRSISPATNTDKTKSALISEQSDNDDTKENLNPVTSSCKNVMDRLQMNVTLIKNDSNISTNSNKQSEDENLTQSMCKIIEDDDERRSHNLNDDTENNSNIAVNTNDKNNGNIIQQNVEKPNFGCATDSTCVSYKSTIPIQCTLLYEKHTANDVEKSIKNINATDLKVFDTVG